MSRFHLSDWFTSQPDQVIDLLDDVDIHFQPICAVGGDGSVCGFEALGRKAGADGYKSIEPFLKDIYKAGLRPELEIVTLEKARVFLQMCDAHLEPEVAAPLYVTVNLSPQTLAQRDLLKQIEFSAGLYAHTVDRIRFEILEHSFPHHEQSVILDNIRALHEEGYKLYLDDFGDHPGQDEERLLALHDQIYGIKLSGSLWKRTPEDRNGFLRAVAQAGGRTKNIVVEGVEDDAHLAEVQGMRERHGFRVLLAQGWHPALGASMSPQTAIEAFSRSGAPGPEKNLD